MRTTQQHNRNITQQCVSLSVASISKESFYKFHPACNTLIKGRLTPGNVAQLTDHLCEEFNDHLETLGDQGSGGLNELVR